MDKVIEKFKNTLTKIVSIPEDEWNHFVKHLSKLIFEKNEYLVRAGEMSDSKHLPWKMDLLVRFIHSHAKRHVVFHPGP